VLEIIDLKKKFGEQTVLNGVNLKVATGELLAILGKSGGGKSVLLKHIIGLLKPDSGRILIDGADIANLSTRELNGVRQTFAVVFQSGALFDSMTIFENVAFPVKEKFRLPDQEIERRVRQVHEDVGLEGVDDKYPSEISGGMKKRAALARALVTEPKIIFFDEPTTGLDPILLHQIHEYIKSTHLKYGFTGIIISHDVPEIFDIADKVALLSDGTIVEEGTPAEIQSSSNPVVRSFVPHHCILNN
jgi:phospholipid/cholesterol/gamma-HCH transport system ATP-binding protein